MTAPTNTTHQQPSQPPLEWLQGVVERVTYHDETAGFTVARLSVPGQHDLITIVGHFPAIAAGQTLRLSGYWREHPQYGQQFQIVSAQETKPATLTAWKSTWGVASSKALAR